MQHVAADRWRARFALPTQQNLQFIGARIMSNESSLSQAELNDRIRILEDNIRQLVEQAAAASGEQNESRIADRLSQQNEELDRLTRERDARSKK
jgi:hypothetical protein